MKSGSWLEMKPVSTISLLKQNKLVCILPGAKGTLPRLPIPQQRKSGNGCSWIVAKTRAHVYRDVIVKLLSRCAKCFIVLGDYVWKVMVLVWCLLVHYVWPRELYLKADWGAKVIMKLVHIDLGFASPCIINWINQPYAESSQVCYLSFKYSSTCFGHPHAHHQELQQLQWQPLVYRRSLVIAVLFVVVGPTISLIILTPMKILQRNLNRSTFFSFTCFTQWGKSASNFVAISSLVMKLLKKCRVR